MTHQSAAGHQHYPHHDHHHHQPEQVFVSGVGKRSKLTKILVDYHAMYGKHHGGNEQSNNNLHIHPFVRIET